jgi:hypothetical protein
LDKLGDFFSVVLHPAQSAVDAEIVVFWLDKQLVGVLKPAFFDAVNPDNVRRAKGCSGFWCRANKVSNHMSAVTRGNVTQHTHTPSLFDAVSYAKSKVFVDLLTDFIGVEMNAL